jgi:hypothetical protein
MPEALIVTCTPYIDAGLIAIKRGDATAVRFYLGLPYGPEYLSADDKAKLERLAAFAKRAQALENVFGAGSLLEVDDPSNRGLLAAGKISAAEFENARVYRNAIDSLD